MTLPTGGYISLTDVMNELRIANPGRAYPISLGDADVLALAGKSAPPISLSDLYRKSSYTPMTATTANGNSAYDATYSAGTAFCNPAVFVSNGSGAYSFAWAFTSNPNGCALSNASSSACTVSAGYAQSSAGSAGATLQCTITDGTGNVLVKSGITSALTWSTSYIPMTVTGISDSNGATTTTGGGTVGCSPRVTVTGGSGGQTYAWSFVDGAQGCNLASASGAACSVTHTFAKNSTGAADPQLRCVVTDNTGHTAIAFANAFLEWSSNA
jgi:hypothetical protein